MAIYRPPKPRWPLAVVTGLLGALVGFGAGYLIGDKPPEASDSVRAIRTTLISAAGSLDVAAVEYRESVVDGQIERRQEYDGALAALRSSRSKFEEVRGALESLFPEGLEPIDNYYETLERRMQARAPAAEVEGYIEELQAILKGTT